MIGRRWRFRRGQPLHETTRRALCRWAFVVCALLPLGITLGVCIAEALPPYQRARAHIWASQLATYLGCRVEVDAVELRAPNRRILHGVKLLHPETGQLMVRVQAVDIVDNSAGFALLLQKPDIAEDQAAELYRLVHEHVLTRPVATPQVTMAMLHDVTWRGMRKAQLRDVRVELRRDSRQTTAGITFSGEGSGGQAGVLHFSRKHLVDSPSSSLRLNTGDNRLPAHWLSLVAPPGNLLGDSAEWQGQLEIEVSQQHWSLQGSGQFVDLDPAMMTNTRLISGRTQIIASDLRLSEHGLECFKGRLLIEGGRISDELIRAWRWIGIQPAAPIARSVSMAHPFQRLAVEIQLDARGLQLHPSLHSQALIQDQLGPLVEQTYHGMIPLVNVVASLTEAIDPSGSQNLVESAAARSIVRWLPGPNNAEVITADQTGHQANAQTEVR